MFGKVFDSIFDSTLIAEGGWLPTYIFMSMIAIADKDGYVEVAPRALYFKLGFRESEGSVAYDEFERAINYLCQVDTYSKSTDFDGRRLIPISQLDEVEGGRGWWIVNYKNYRDRASREDRAAQSTDRVRRFRERKKINENNDETQCNTGERKKRHTDTDTDTDTDKKTGTKARPCGADEVQRYLDQRGIVDFTGQQFLDHYDACGWVYGKGRKPVKDWKACVRTWQTMRKNSSSSSDEVVCV